MGWNTWNRGGCGCGSPFAPPVPLNPCAGTVQVNNFGASIVATNAFVIPQCGGTVILNFAGLYGLNVGTYLFNATYGHFKVTAVDLITGNVTVQNECISTYQTVGAVVPALTSFAVVGSPQRNYSMDIDISVVLGAPLSIVSGTAGYTITVGFAPYFQVHDVWELTGTQGGLFIVQSIIDSNTITANLYPTPGTTYTVQPGNILRKPFCVKGTGVVLIGGAATVVTAAARTTSSVLLTRTAFGGTPGELTANIVDLVEFNIQSSNVLDTSTLNWAIFGDAG